MNEGWNVWVSQGLCADLGRPLGPELWEDSASCTLRQVHKKSDKYRATKQTPDALIKQWGADAANNVACSASGHAVPVVRGAEEELSKIALREFAGMSKLSPLTRMHQMATEGT